MRPIIVVLHKRIPKDGDMLIEQVDSTHANQRDAYWWLADQIVAYDDGYRQSAEIAKASTFFELEKWLTTALVSLKWYVHVMDLVDHQFSLPRVPLWRRAVFGYKCLCGCRSNEKFHSLQHAVWRSTQRKLRGAYRSAQ